MKNAQEFRVNVPKETLDNLEVRLRSTRWPGQPEGQAWEYGTNEVYLRELVDYWLNQYDWRTQEALLNRYPQYIAEVQGHSIHFQYVKGQGENAKPLVLTHGWPDSYHRFHRVIPLLTQGEMSFDLIIPSIPGFGFSERSALPTKKIAALWKELVTVNLGYESFYAAGGDMGALITRELATNFSDVVEAVHFTDIGYPMGDEDPETMTQAEQEFAEFVQQWWMQQGSYAMIHSTKPQSVAFGFNDSPVGLAAWILNFISIGVDPEGIEAAFGGRDALLTNIMIYWVTQTIATSMRMYKVDQKELQGGSPSSAKSDVPAGIALFPREAQFPREWAERFVRVERFTKMSEGGHFAALEVPDAYVAELKTFFSKY